MKIKSTFGDMLEPYLKRLWDDNAWWLLRKSDFEQLADIMDKVEEKPVEEWDEGDWEELT